MIKESVCSGWNDGQAIVDCVGNENSQVEVNHEEEMRLKRKQEEFERNKEIVNRRVENN